MGRTREPILVDAPDFLVNAFKDFMVCRYKETYYQKNEDGYLYYCKHCGKEQRITKERFKKIRYTGLCPNCHSASALHLKPYKKDFYKHNLFGWIDEQGNKVGYYCLLTENSFFCKQVAYWRDGLLYARYVSCFMCDGISYNEEKRPNFTRRRNGGYYSSLEYSFHWIMEGKEQRYGCFVKPRTYKEYLNDNQYIDIDYNDFKSNQIYMIKNNIFNKKQIQAIKYFDLKNPDEVYKNRKYIDKCVFNRRARILNIHYLDYLNKNKINYFDFMDYCDDLDALGYKYDKPKDFIDRHEKIGALVLMKKDMKYEKGIIESYEKLKEKTVDKTDYCIKPIESIEEINYVAKHLHNCMARLYTKSYSKGETDLYCMWKDKKPFIAIEVLDGKLKQVRTDHNGTPESKDKAIVTKWYRRVYAN